MELYIIRHGETDWNKARRVQGRADIPLNEFGRSLARKTRKGLLDVPFEVCYTSPLKRARETAELVLEGRGIEVRDEERIIEINFGEYEGLCCDEKNWNIPDPDFMKFFRDPENYQPPRGGETFYEVQKRVGEFFRELYDSLKNKEAPVLIATHGAALGTMLNLFKGEPISKVWGKGVHRNCEVTIVNWKPDDILIENEGIVYYDDDVKSW